MAILDGTPEWYRQKAKEARGMAGTSQDNAIAQQFSEIAKTYDAMADYAEMQRAKRESG